MGRPVGRPTGAVNGISTEGPPGLRNWISNGALSTDFLVIEDFKYGFNACQVTATGVSEMPVQIAPWEIKKVDAGGDCYIRFVDNEGQASLDVAKGADAADSIDLVYAFEPFDCVRPWAWQVKLKWEDVSVMKVFVGLHVHKNQATISSTLGGNCIGFSNITDHNGSILAAGALKAVSRASSSQSGTENSVATIADNTYITLGCEWDGTTLRYFVDDAEAAAYTTNIPADGTTLAPSVCFTGTEAAQDKMTIDYMAWYAEGE